MLILFPSLTIRLFKSSMKLMFIVTEKKNCLVRLCQERPDGYFSKVLTFPSFLIHMNFHSCLFYHILKPFGQKGVVHVLVSFQTQSLN